MVINHLCRYRAAVVNGEDEAALNDSGGALEKAVDIRFDSRKTHNNELLYTT